MGIKTNVDTFRFGDRTILTMNTADATAITEKDVNIFLGFSRCTVGKHPVENKCQSFVIY